MFNLIQMNQDTFIIIIIIIKGNILGNDIMTWHYLFNQRI